MLLTKAMMAYTSVNGVLLWSRHHCKLMLIGSFKPHDTVIPWGWHHCGCHLTEEETEAQVSWAVSDRARMEPHLAAGNGFSPYPFLEGTTTSETMLTLKLTPTSSIQPKCLRYQRDTLIAQCYIRKVSRKIHLGCSWCSMHHFGEPKLYD